MAEQSTSLLPAPAPTSSAGLLIPAALANAPEKALSAFIEFFAATLPNANTRSNYLRDVKRFFAWCQERHFDPLTVNSIHLSGYREDLRRDLEPPSVKRHFSSLRSLYAWWVEKGVLDKNPVREVKTEKFSRTEGKTPALSSEDTRRLFESFDTSSLVGLRDRALIGVMAYTFARVEAVVSLRVKDYAPLGKRFVIYLSEKGGKQREIPANHRLEEYLDAYIEAAAIGELKDTPLFRSAAGRTGKLTDRGMARQDAYELIRRRLRDAGIAGAFGCHSFRATGITTFLENGGLLETAQWIAGHADSRTTKLYDKRNQRATLEDLERVRY